VIGASPENTCIDFFDELNKMSLPMHSRVNRNFCAVGVAARAARADVWRSFGVSAMCEPRSEAPA
jgi:hypothetical protein